MHTYFLDYSIPLPIILTTNTKQQLNFVCLRIPAHKQVHYFYNRNGLPLNKFLMVGCIGLCLECFETVGWASGNQPESKKRVLRCWHGCLSGVRCKWFAYGPADATASPSSVASLKSRLV